MNIQAVGVMDTYGTDSVIDTADSTQKVDKAINILIVEDNAGDIRLTLEALKRSNIPNELYVAKDGIEAMSLLNNSDAQSKGIRPDMVLLDLNLPKKSGHEVLQGIKQNEELKRIPVLVLTTSKSESDIIAAYNNHANCYLTKPIGFKRFNEVIRCIESFWFSMATLPPK